METKVRPSITRLIKPAEANSRAGQIESAINVQSELGHGARLQCGIQEPASLIPPYLSRIRNKSGKPRREYPFDLPFVAGLDLAFTGPVTFFVGENGTGKSTLIEAIAEICRLPVSGGSRNELGESRGPKIHSSLSGALAPSFRKQPPDGFFFRADFHVQFASMLDERKHDPDFAGNPYSRYGGRSLLTQSHGESFLSVLKNRFQRGIFLLDEPESALSPQRQLSLLSLIYDLVKGGGCQFIVATHSPILMTYPAAQVVSFDHKALQAIRPEETPHYRITRGILESPERYWRHLVA